jgi:hypothetical protein|eukprot:5058727-Prymnesium_polylepis.1
MEAMLTELPGKLARAIAPATVPASAPPAAGMWAKLAVMVGQAAGGEHADGVAGMYATSAREEAARKLHSWKY